MISAAALVPGSPAKPLKVLYLEDDPSDAELVLRHLMKVNPAIEVEVVGDLAAAAARIDAFEADLERGEPVRYDILLLDMNLPDGSGLEILNRVRMRSLPLAAIVLTGTGDEDAALKALRAGADDYLVKKPDFWTRLPSALTAAAREFNSTTTFHMRPIRMLYLEHNESDVEFTRIHLAAYAPFIQLETVATSIGAIERLSRDDDRNPIDIFLMDFRLPTMDGLELIKEINQVRGLDIPIIVATGHGSEENAVQTVKLGAMDYLVKAPGYLFQLPLVVERAYYLRSAERERAALKASERHLRSIIETEPECVQVISRTGLVLEMNPAGLRMFEADSLDAVKARLLTDFLVQDYRDAFRNLHARVMTGEAASLVFEINGLKGGRRWLETHATPMRDALGNVEALLGITRDITDRKRDEEMLRQGEKLTAIGQLAAGIAHDFNNQLGVMLGYAELLGTKLVDEDLKRHCEAIATAAKNSGNLTRNLLTFSRQGHFETVPLDFHELINEVIHLLGRSIDKRILIKRRLQAHHSVLRGDPATLQNALLNLGLNGRDAMPNGGLLTFGTETVEIDGTDRDGRGPIGESFTGSQADPPPGSYLHVEVADTGTGMTEEIKKRIFEPFFTTKSIGKGTGMGLASVFGTVRIHNGNIAVDSEPGRGTVFHVYLPLAPVRMELERFEGPAATAPKELTILLIEDEREIGNLIAEMLKVDGHRIFKTEGGKDALEIYRERWREIDLVLLDMVMLDMDGEETFHALRQVDPSVRVLISSGFSPEGKIKSLLDEGALGLLQKPFNKAQLDKMIAHAMA